MSVRVTVQTKIQQGRGTGTGADYKPWICAREFNSQGTCNNIRDWKHGRSIELLSVAETDVYRILRFDDETDDIREQFPLLDIDIVTKIADHLNVRLPFSTKERVFLPLTTDLLVTKTDKSLEAYSVKYDREALIVNEQDSDMQKKLKQRQRDLLNVQKMYWNSRGVPWYEVYVTDAMRIYSDNIMRSVYCYDYSYLETYDGSEKSLVNAFRCAVAHKLFDDVYELMQEELLDFVTLAHEKQMKIDMLSKEVRGQNAYAGSGFSYQNR